MGVFVRARYDYRDLGPRKIVSDVAETFAI
jgi:hypothetical protein